MKLLKYRIYDWYPKNMSFSDYLVVYFSLQGDHCLRYSGLPNLCLGKGDVWALIKSFNVLIVDFEEFYAFIYMASLKKVGLANPSHFCVIALVLLSSQKIELCFHLIQSIMVILSIIDILRSNWTLKYK
jgi:hypothetical protein